MVTYLNVLTEVDIDSASVTSYDANPDELIIVDTATAAVTINMPTGTAIGSSIVIKNSPVDGPQVGGNVTGNTITINPGTGETIEGSSSDSLGPPSSYHTEATRQYWPTGANSGSGDGEAGFTGWCH